MDLELAILPFLHIFGEAWSGRRVCWISYFFHFVTSLYLNYTSSVVFPFLIVLRIPNTGMRHVRPDDAVRVARANK